MSGFDRSFVYCRAAYGREVSSQDYNAGLDFQIVSGPYFSIRDESAMRNQGIKTLMFLNDRGFVEFTVNL